MAGTLIARDLHKAHGAATILAGVSVTVAPGEVLGVVGPNGAGKSTLLRLLAGLDRPDHGDVRLTAGTAGYLPQEPDRAPGERCRTTSRAAPASRRPTRESRPPRTTWPPTCPARRTATPTRSRRGWSSAAPTCEQRAETVLRDLGLDPPLLDLETAALSGGQAARASLAAILLSRFDVLLLDEPTNDLDFDGLARLERFVAERPGGAVIVSHDRAFLARTVTRVLELDEIAHTAAEYGGGWAGYLELRATAARHAEDALRELHGAKRDRLTDRVQHPAPVVGHRASRRPRPPRAQSPTSRSAITWPSAPRSRRRRSARPRRRSSGSTTVEKPWKRWELQLRFGGGERSGDVTVRLDSATLQRGSFILGPLDLELAWGERVALVGPNGSGKTTLVDALIGRLPLAVGHALDRPRRADRDARPGARGLRRRGRADRRLRRAERDDAAGGALAAGQVRPRARRGRARGARASRRASAPARASRC